MFNAEKKSIVKEIRGLGLMKGIELTRGIRGIGVIEFHNEDIVRHPLVTKIVRAFDRL